MADSELTAREIRLLELLADGFRYRDIAPHIGYKNDRSVKNVAKLIFDKIGADNQTHAVAMALRRGIIH
jgi:DNA-binding NarL/FixJ family response regulator